MLLISANTLPYSEPFSHIPIKRPARQAGTKSNVTVPLRGGGLVVGAVLFVAIFFEKHWSEQEVQRASPTTAAKLRSLLRASSTGGRGRTFPSRPLIARMAPSPGGGGHSHLFKSRRHCALHRVPFL